MIRGEMAALLGIRINESIGNIVCVTVIEIPLVAIGNASYFIIFTSSADVVA